MTDRKMPKMLNKPKPPPGEFASYAGEMEMKLIWNVFNAKSGTYDATAWMYRLPEYIGMLRIFKSMGAPWGLLVKNFRKSNIFQEENLKDRAESYVKSLFNSIESFANQNLTFRGQPINKRNRKDISVKIPEPKTLYQMFRALWLLGIPRATKRIYFKRADIDPESCSELVKKETYLLGRNRFPVEEFTALMPTWKQAVDFVSRRNPKPKGRLGGFPAPKSLAEFIVHRAQVSLKDKSFKDFMSTFADDIDSKVTDRETLLELFSYQQLCAAIKTMEDFSSLIDANQSLPEELRQSSEEIWCTWQWIHSNAQDAAFGEIGRKTLEAINDLIQLQCDTQDS